MSEILKPQFLRWTRAEADRACLRFHPNPWAGAVVLMESLAIKAATESSKKPPTNGRRSMRFPSFRPEPELKAAMMVPNPSCCLMRWLLLIDP